MKNSFAGYAVAMVTTSVALALTAAFPEFLAPMRLFFLWCAILTTAVVAGFRPALLSIAMSVAGAAYLIFVPLQSFRVAGAMDLARITAFALFSGAISLAVASRKRAVERAEAFGVKFKSDEAKTAFIARASEVLASSLGYEQTMRNLARLCVPAIGDWCGIDVGEGEGYEHLVVEHTDPARLHMVKELDRYRRPPELDFVVQVMRSGKAQLIENITDEMLVAASESPEHLRMLRELGLRSCVIAPMIARGRTLGALTVVYGESGRHYTQDDVPFIEDLARRAATAIDNARLYEAAEAANRAKDEFLATLSHELRTPLTAISGWAHMLKMGMTDAATTKLAVDTILRSAQTQAELIDDLLDVSRVVAGTLHLDIITADLTKIIEEVVVAARPAAEAKQLRLEVIRAPNVFVRGDERRLRQIVWNLVSNAVKFTDEGGSIEIALSVRNANAEVTVKDTGRGIDPSFLPHVFERFRQADSSTSRRHGGLGLGLAVVRHLVELHGGTVRADSAGLGKGATFCVRLPLARLGERAAASPHSADATAPLRNRRVLVVDDDDDARLVLATMLSHAGAEVVSAASAAQAIALLSTNTFDVVVSDIAMPGEDGFTLMRRIRDTAEIPVIAVSAMGTGEEDYRRAMDAGFHDFVRKPVDPSQLAMTVARAVV